MPRDKSELLVERAEQAAQDYQAAVDAFDEAAAVRLGVNRTDLRCIEILSRGEPATPGRLGTALGLTSGSVTAMLDRLERLGHVTRARDGLDRRKVLVHITPETLRRVGGLYGPLAEEGAQELIHHHTPEEIRLIAAFLERSRRLYEHHLARVRSP